MHTNPRFKTGTFWLWAAALVMVVTFIAIALHGPLFGPASTRAPSAQAPSDRTEAAKVMLASADLEPIHVPAAEVPRESTSARLPGPLAIPNNPGIVAWEPVCSGPSMDEAAFGAGCARWLTVAVGGLPQMGRQCAYVSAQRVADEWRRTDLRLTPQQGVSGGKLLGLTHVAVGRLTGTAGRLSLSYQVLDVRTGAPIGAPVTLFGSPDEIAARLPGAAKEIAARLHITPGKALGPESTGAADLATLGRFPWQVRNRIPVGQLQQIEDVASRVPAAALSALDAIRWQDPERFMKMVKATVALAPGNVMVLAEAARQAGFAVPEQHLRVAVLQKKHPNNYLLVRTEIRLRPYAKWEDFVAATRKAARLSPGNPDAWLAYSNAVQMAADDIRRGKVYIDLTPAEEAYVSRVYPEAEAAARHAVRLDPQYGLAWRQLAQAAQFNGDDALADGAYWKAMHLDREDPQLYFWGLQMFQPKWQGGADKLAKVARLATQEVFQSPYNARQTGRILREMGYFAQAQVQFDRAMGLYRDLIKERPNTAWLRVEMAGTLFDMGRPSEAIKEYRAVAAQYPDNAAAHFQLGVIFTEQENYADAEKELREAVRLAPEDGVAHDKLGFALVQQKQWKEGEAEIRKGLKYEPDWSRGHEALAYALHMQHRLKEAIPEYMVALRLEPTAGTTWDRLTRALNESKRYKEAVQVGEHGMIYNRDYPYAYASLGEAYLGAKQYGQSAAMYNQYLQKMNGDAGAHMLYAQALFGLGRNGEAVEECNTCIRLMPNSPAAGIARDLLSHHGAPSTRSQGI